jgi:heme A synthase
VRVSLTDWILALHVLSAFALVASMVLFWVLVVATRTLTDVDARITYGRVGPSRRSPESDDD